MVLIFERVGNKIEVFVIIIIFGNGITACFAGIIGYFITVFGGGGGTGRAGTFAFLFPLGGGGYCGTAFAGAGFINASGFADGPAGEFITAFGKTESFCGFENGAVFHAERTFGFGSAACAGTCGIFDVKFINGR